MCGSFLLIYFVSLQYSFFKVFCCVVNATRVFCYCEMWVVFIRRCGITILFRIFVATNIFLSHI